MIDQVELLHAMDSKHLVSLLIAVPSMRTRAIGGRRAAEPLAVAA